LAIDGIIQPEIATGCPSKWCGIENQAIFNLVLRFSKINFFDFSRCKLQQFLGFSYKIKVVFRKIKKSIVRMGWKSP